jgi:nicotinamidase-related amidase
MSLNDIERKKTAILFFDILNGYYHTADEAKKARMKPWVDNAVRLMKTGRETAMPIFFAHGNHRADGATSVTLLTDTDNALKPWPNGVVTPVRPPAVGDDWSSHVIPELDPRPDDYYIPKYRWSAFHKTYLDLALRARGINTIIVSGGSTDVGVVATIFSARDLDYHTIVVHDACGTSHDQRAHDFLMELIFPRMGRVRSTDEVLEMIRQAKEK